MPTTGTGTAGDPRKPWRFVLAALLGALAGATLFPWPARGGARDDLRPDPPPAGPDSVPPNG